MENNTATLPAINTEQLVTIVNQAPAILEKNKLSRDKAIGYGNSLIGQASQHGMTDDLDSLMANYLEKLRVTHKAMNESRKPFTQLVDEVKKRFTELESDVAPSGKGNIFAQVQELRDKYATAKIEEQRRREREAAEKLAREKEAIQITQQVETAFASHVQQLISQAIISLNNSFESATLSTVENARQEIAGFMARVPQAAYYKFKPSIYANYLSSDQVQAIIDTTLANGYTEANLEYANQVNACKRELIDKLPSKVAELEEIARAGSEQADALRKEAEARRKAAEEEANRKAQEEARRKADEAAARAAAEALEASINSQAEAYTGAPKVKEGYEITVKNPVAYALIFQFWFEKEGREWPYDKIEKMTISRMKAFCEAYAIKTGEVINSRLIEYKEIFKAK